MEKFRIVPLSKEYTQKIKSDRIDDFGNEVIELVATGKGPCRLSLKPFTVNVDKRLLFKYSPFELQNAYNESGPIFINSEDVEEYTDIYKFPPGIKADKEHFPLSLLGYSKEQKMVFSELVGDRDVDEFISEIFDNYPEIDFLHARNSEACCFICKIVRA